MRASVMRNVGTTQDRHGKRIESLSLVNGSVPCRVMPGGTKESTDGKDVALSTHTMFAGPDAPIQKGDRVIVRETAYDVASVEAKGVGATRFVTARLRAKV